MEKSYVSMEQKVCPICTKKHNVGLFLDKRLKNSMERNTITGYGICPECNSLDKKGFLGLVEIDPVKSESDGKGRVSLEGAYRTGRVFHLKRESELCSHLVGEGQETPFIFIDIELGNKLVIMQQKVE